MKLGLAKANNKASVTRESEHNRAGQEKCSHKEEKEVDNCVCECTTQLQSNIFEDWDYPGFVYQSEVIEETSMASVTTSDPVMEISQNVAFHEGTIGQNEDYTRTTDNKVALVDGSPDISLGKFLSRPTLLSSVSWTEATTSMTDLITSRPYYDFLNNTKIKKKIDNFAYIRGKLHLKVIVNSTPFNYGYARLIYNPCEGFSSDPGASTSSTIRRIAYSQYPHVEILPQNSQGGEMVLPRLLHTNWLDLASASFLQNCGTARVTTFTALLSANGQSTFSSTIQLYAWMTDVELMGATSALAVQSDEYSDDGPVSKVASAISKVAAFAAGAVSEPSVAAFATATSMITEGIAHVARHFGYSNPPVIENITPVQQSNLPHLASSEISVYCDKLTLDPKSELCYDSSWLDDRQQDYTLIKNFTQHESLLTLFQFGTSDNIVNQQLWNARINPCLYADVPATGVASGMTQIAGTPMSHVSQLFKYWRGDLKFRFKFIISKFHKGRFRITFDPRGNITTDSDTINTSLTRIVDVGEEDDVTIVVPYHQRTTWLRCRKYSDVLTEDGNQTPGNSLSPNYEFDNGLINLRVQTLLSAPVSTANWYILIFVSAGDNFELAVPGQLVPEDTQTYLSILPFQSHEYDDDKVLDGSIQVSDFSHSHHSTDMYLTNVGEVFPSLKSLMSRSVIAKNYSLPSASANALSFVRLLTPRIPTPYGFNSAFAGVQEATSFVSGGATKVGYDTSAIQHPITWITACFKGYRGSFLHRFNLETKSYNAVDKLYVTRHDGSRGADDTRGRIVNSLATGSTRAAHNAWLNTISCNPGIGGACATAQRNNNSLNVVLPDYNLYNFRYYVPSNLLLGSSTDGSNTDTYSLNMFIKPTDATSQALDQVTVTQFIAAGVDYKPIWFQCVPPVYYASQLPVPN